ncbi:hypothetical protein [Methylobacterium sp. JK268]
MAEASRVPWTDILEQVNASISQLGLKPVAEVHALRPSLAAHAGRDQEADPPSDRADWTDTLDMIETLGELASEKSHRSEDQTTLLKHLVAELRREVARLTEDLRNAGLREQAIQGQTEQRLQEIRARADARTQDIRAESEQRVQRLQAEARAQLQAAEERARIAEIRADTAEKWLKRIHGAAQRQIIERRSAP